MSENVTERNQRKTREGLVDWVGEFVSTMGEAMEKTTSPAISLRLSRSGNSEKLAGMKSVQPSCPPAREAPLKK